jgi:hypothetical protein
MHLSWDVPQDGRVGDPFTLSAHIEASPAHSKRG